jgi:sugar phosphate isomerase/epimerase
MKPGVVGLMPNHARDITAETAARLRSSGFTGVTVRVLDPLVAERAEFERAGKILRDGGVEVAQANPTYEVLVHPDETLRARGIEALRAACQVATWLGAGTVYVRPGSLNPAGAWTPHPENTSLRTIECLVDSLRRTITAAEEAGIPLAMEGGSTCPIDTPERVRDVIEAVGSPALGFNADPVNFVRSLDELYNMTSLTHRLFDLCGKYVVCAHTKDITYESALPVRLRECPLGEGLCDQVTYLQRFEQSCPQGYFMIEHLPDDQIPAAKANLDAALRTAGLTWK